ncbi:hypothetical protein K490DRAFT_74239 [Saccharata proteae CBS 121410]|uniref:Uncharacterized protein n=1 Tax=Saccharata proteae CBS 121410 TaxID=1314787 RepID=A0A9P4HRI6_9PEZI|nr:hypothetical protein K490DRAFT_74239 [Saccharata proteae CBS 121410]
MDTRPSPAEDSKLPSKYASPAPPSSSMTPPPSSQVPPVALNRSSVRTPTPPTPQLSSPPPTQRSGSISFTNEQVSNASTDELRGMVGELLGALREARTSAAHHKLQYNLLSLDSSEVANRMEVELTMAQREVEVLQQAEERRRSNITSPTDSVHEPSLSAENAALLNEMSRHCQMLQSENEELRNMLGQARRSVEKRDGQIASLLEDNERLRGRIRKNREHMNALGLLDGTYYPDISSPRSVMGSSTPRYPITPSRGARNRGHTTGSPHSTRTQNQQPFEALLIADEMLRQGPTATAPSTPTRAGPTSGGRGHFSHARNTHSLSSIASPHQRGPRPPMTVPHTPPTFAAATSAPIPHSAPAAHKVRILRPVLRRERSHESTDSTITASSVEAEAIPDAGAGSFDSAKDVEIAESSASQMAGELLRRSGEQRVPPTFETGASAADRGSSKQSKLFGRVTKPGLKRGADLHEKRSISATLAEEAGSPPKRGRVGLGIGGLDGSH